MRFNGVQFKVFDKSNTKGLTTNRFTALYEDKDGTLWIGTNDAGVTCYRNGVFASYAAAGEVPPGPVLYFTHDLKGVLLAGIGSGQFYMRGGKFITAQSEHGVQVTRINYLAPSRSQWIIEANEARQVHDGSVTRYPIKLKSISNSRPMKTARATCGWALSR